MKKVISAFICIVIAVGLFSSFSFAESEKIYLSDLEPSSFTIIDTVPAPSRDKNLFGQPLRVDGVKYNKGISTHPVALGVPTKLYTI